ncbi:hypothetical protein MRB53_041842 [Persea americana]|nr:hypothetical protein MRB53_041842 [Persea americana]
MGISRDSRHKRSATGAKRAHYRKKSQPTRVSGAKRIHLVRTRGGNTKYRAHSAWTAATSPGRPRASRAKTRVIGVAYHPSNNELVRTNTLTRSAGRADRRRALPHVVRGALRRVARQEEAAEAGQGGGGGRQEEQGRRGEAGC